MAQRSSFNGGFRLFEVAGITVYLHWLWFVVAFYELRPGSGAFSSGPLPWRVAEYLTLFAIVLVHEFGHSLACRSVGGSSDRILLWPFGGISFVQPPQRPGATLWSIAAGPLVNVLLIPVFFAAHLWIAPLVGPAAQEFIRTVMWMNIALLLFNLAPIYPLDGGQILRSLLWYAVGAVLSLQIATVIGVLGAIGVLLFAIKIGSTWLVILSLLGAFQCYAGFQQARELRKIERIPRHNEFACPKCGAVPPAGNFWQCQCGQKFDLFASGFVCPNCRRHHSTAQCGACGTIVPAEHWNPQSPTSHVPQRPLPPAQLPLPKSF